MNNISLKLLKFEFIPFRVMEQAEHVERMGYVIQYMFCEEVLVRKMPQLETLVEARAPIHIICSGPWRLFS